MTNVLASPAKSLTLGLLIVVAIISAWLALSGADAIGFTSFLLRAVHVVAAMIWVGMIWFVNFIQLLAVSEADAAGKSAIMKLVVPRVAFTFRHAAHLTIVSGVLLLVTTGYLLDSLIYASPVYIPSVRSILMWIAVIGAFAMYAFVHMVIWPGLRIVLGQEPADETAVTAARTRVAAYARWNLILALPVTVTMIAAAHLY